ncbi:DUF3696 domain-containing protein [Pseudomonas sp. NFIX28]|uniref:DUF3696 domain-containing protein n=1 Tax=Pseudomonas sp. NFIX28 TaxID=1566235 RepID=UPI0008997184|nr:DUF3696 domain-containing protein [Pseudomonas sp. NFIX28]SDZ59588.1 Protein of unknown function [Pseudomonas sp. NFIX28]
MFHMLSVENFKSFSAKQSVKLAPITLIYGPNSSGKSSLIQSLMLLKQSLTRPSEQGGLVSNGEYVDLGDYAAMAHNHSVDSEMKFSYSYSTLSNVFRHDWFAGSVSLPKGSKGQIATHELTYMLSGKGKKSKNEEFTYLSNIKTSYGDDKNNAFELNLRSDLISRENAEKTQRLKHARGFHFTTAESRDSIFSFFSRMKGISKDYHKEIVKGLNDVSFRSDLNYATPSSVTIKDKIESGFGAALMNNLVTIVAKEIQEAFNSITYLGPLRSHPSRFYAPKGDQSGSVGKQGENTARFIYEKSPDITGKINEWFSNFEIPYTLTAESIGSAVTGSVICLQLKDLRTDVVVGPSDVGFGIGQLLPIIVEGIVRGESTICVEQPEIHLHPRLQAHLANFFIETSKTNQWIIETHSESLMLRMQNKIRQKEIAPSDVSVIYVQPTKSGAQIIEIPMDDDGDFLVEWPEGFFEERFKETFGL